MVRGKDKGRKLKFLLRKGQQGFRNGKSLLPLWTPAGQGPDPQGGRLSRAEDMCSRSCPDPLGIAAWFDKLEFGGFAELTIDS